MALSLTLNGTTTTTISGSPANGDRIAMSNGTIRLSFTWNTHGGARWNTDLVEYSANSGTTWTSLLYGRDTPRLALSGYGENVGTNGALSIITNTASTITLQLVATAVVNTVTYTFTSKYTMTSTQNNVEVSQYLATSAAVNLTNNQTIEDYGACWFSPGLSTSVVALCEGIGSIYSSTRTNPVLYSGNLTSGGRQYARNGNRSRGYGGGMSLLLSTGHLVSFVVSPTSAQNLQTNVLDTISSTPMASMNWQWIYKSYLSWFVGTDSAYQGLHDTTPIFVRPGTIFTAPPPPASGATFPQSTSTTNATTTLNLTWSIAIDLPAQTGGNTGLPISRHLMIQNMNKWQDTLYARPNIGGSGILGGGTSVMWQPLATLESNVTPVLASTYTTYFETTYGYWLHISATTTRTSISSGLALQTCLRWNNLGVGNSDALTMANQLAVIIANYQTQSGVQAGAIQKLRNTTANTFTCQENNHASNTDQPHVSMYSMAECLYALIEYFKVRGNQTLAATYGSITVAAVLDAAMTWLVKVQQSDGGWLVEYNNANIATAQNPQGGASYPGSATVDLGASLYSWSISSPTATATQKTQWAAQGLRGVRYYMTSESAAHGNFEFGEGYTTHSHSGTKQLARGFMRMYRMTGSPSYQEWMAYYFEMAILLCKKVDEVISNTNTNSQNVHTGALESTIDWNGVVAGEGSSNWALFATEVLALHPGLLAHHYFYIWANICHITWGYRDVATYQSSLAFSYAYASPGTNYAGNAYGLDNTRFSYFAPGAALMLLPTRTLVACDNVNVLSTCLEGNSAVDVPVGRTIVVYNPQGSSQTANITIRGQSGKYVTQDGSPITGTTSGSDMVVALTLTSGQITKIVTR